jgi:AcrR family transcriptional regulator
MANMPARRASFDGVPAAGIRQLQGPGRFRDGSSEMEQRIFAATEALLQGSSLADLTVGDIAERAGVSRRTFYSYFPSKGAVLVAMAAKLIAESSEYFGPLAQASSGESGRQILLRTVETNVRLWTEHGVVLRAMTENWHVLPELREMWLATINQFTDVIAAEIDRERAAGEAPAGVDSGKLAALLLWSTGHCLYVAGLDIDRNLKGKDGIYPELLSLWMGAIYGEPYATPPP